MDTKEWFKLERNKIENAIEGFGWDNLEDVTSSTCYSDKDNPNLQWVISVTLKKIKVED